MPYETRWVTPEIFLEHKNVTVFCVYEDDSVENSALRYIFTVDENCGDNTCACSGGCSAVFDVRHLPTWKEEYAAHSAYSTEGEHALRSAMVEAIDIGYLTEEGVEEPPT